MLLILFGSIHSQRRSWVTLCVDDCLTYANSVEQAIDVWTTKVVLWGQVSTPQVELQAASLQLHGFSDASEDAYSGVVYENRTHWRKVTLVVSNTRDAPIKHLSIPRLKLCGPYVLTKLWSHFRNGTTSKVTRTLPQGANWSRSMVAWISS